MTNHDLKSDHGRRPALSELIAKWRERERKLCRQADAQPITQYARTLADRAGIIAECADELEAALPASSEGAHGKDTYERAALCE
jgi:hypothetical protein